MPSSEGQWAMTVVTRGVTVTAAVVMIALTLFWIGALRGAL